MAQKFNLDILIRILSEGKENFADLADGLKRLSTEGRDAARTLEAIRVGNRAVKDVQRLTASVSDLSDEIGRIRNVDFNIQSAATFQSRLKFIITDLVGMQRAAREVNDNLTFDNAAIAEKNARALLKELSSLTSEANNFNNALANLKLSNDASRKLKDIKAQIREVTKELNKAESEGDALKIKDEITPKLTKLLRNLTDVEKKFTQLGKLSKVDVVITERGNVKDLQKRIKGLTDDVLNANKQKLVLQAEAKDNFQHARSALRTLERDVERFIKEKGQLTINARVKFEERASNIKQQLQGAAANLPQNQQKQLLQANVSVDKFKENLNSIKPPEGTFRKIGAGFRTISSEIGGTNGLLRGLAGAFRLAGTNAFVAGLRTTGFALTALASIIQNIIPLVIGLGKGLIELGPVGATIAASLGLISAGLLAVAAQATAAFGAIAAVVPTGIKFNTELQTTTNAVAALGQEFFNFTVNGQPFKDTITIAGDALDGFAIAQIAASDQLELLQSEALKTVFSTEQLASALQSVTIGLGALSPSIEENILLTGKFATIAGALNVSADRLNTALREVTSGTGRATNVLQALLDRTKDTKGIELTSKRIRELRKEGGDELFNELSIALDKYTKSAAAANKISFAGVTSNLVDLFQVVSGRATNNAFQLLTNSLNQLFNSLTQTETKTKEVTDRLGKKKTITFDVVTPIKPIQDIEKVIDRILSKVAGDIVNAVPKIIGFIDQIGKFLIDNEETIKDTYDLVVLLFTQFGEILGLLGQILTLGISTTGNFKVLNGLIAILNTTLGVAKIVLGAIVSTLGLAKVGFAQIGLIAVKFVSILGQAAETIGAFFGINFTGFTDSLEKAGAFFASIRDSGVRNFASGFGTIVSGARDIGKTYDILTKKNEKILEQNKKSAKVGTTGKGTADSDASKESRARRDRLKQLLDLENQIAEALRKLALQREQNELKLVQDRLKQQQALVEEGLRQNVIAQQEASAKILAIQQKVIDNEIISRRNALEIVNQERLEKERNFTNEVKDLQDQALQDPKKGGLTQNELKNRLEQLGLKQRKERIEILTREEQLLGEINQLELSRNESQQDYINGIILRSTETRKELEGLRQIIADLKDTNSEEAVNLRVLGVVQERIDTIRELEKEITGIRQVRATTTDPAIAALLESQLRTARERLRLIQEEIVLRQQAIRFEAANAIADKSQFDNQITENNLQRELNQGIIDERTFTVRVTAERIRLRQALEQILAIQEQILKTNPNEALRRQVENLRQNIKDLQTEITDEGLLRGANEARESFTDFFVKIQEDIGNAKDAFADFGRSILNTFRRLLAERIVRDFFSQLFPTEGQTQGRPGGILADIFRGVGLGRDQDQAQAEQTARQKGSLLTKEQLEQLTNIAKASANREATVGEQIDNLSSAIAEETQILRIALKNLSKTFNDASTTLFRIGTDPETLLPVQRGVDAKIKEDTGEKIKKGTDLFVQTLKDGVILLGNGISNSLNRITSSLFTSGTSLVQTLQSLISGIAALISQLNSIQVSTGAAGAGTLTGLFGEDGIPIDMAKGGLAYKKFARGGLVPSRVSNGEYRINPSAVKAYGTGFLDTLNNKPRELFQPAALGGQLINGKFSYAGGGGKLINRPDAIIDKGIPKPRKPSKFKKILGNILSGIAPFLSFIPVIGPLLSLGAGAAGGALTGSEKGLAGGILGGVIGGLSNLGGFAGSDSKFGKFASFFSKGSGSTLLNVLGAGQGNYGQAGGSTLLKILKRLGLFKGGSSSFVDSPSTFGNAGSLFAKNGGLIQSFASGGFASFLKGSGADILGGLLSIFGSFNRSNKPKDIEDILDPDLANINRYGLALKPLRDMGFLPEFLYQKETVDRLEAQESGRTNQTQNESSSRFGDILAGILPFLLLALSGKKKAGGGLVEGSGLIRGKGTGTSDSIFGMLSNGEYIIKAATVKMLGTNILDSINAQRFSSGGLVGSSINALPESPFTPNIEVKHSTNIINQLDPNLFDDYISTDKGVRTIYNVVSRNPRKFNLALERRA